MMETQGGDMSSPNFPTSESRSRADGPAMHQIKIVHNRCDWGSWRRHWTRSYQRTWRREGFRARTDTRVEEIVLGRFKGSLSPILPRSTRLSFGSRCFRRGTFGWYMLLRAGREVAEHVEADAIATYWLYFVALDFASLTILTACPRLGVSSPVPPGMLFGILAGGVGAVIQ